MRVATGVNLERDQAQVELAKACRDVLLDAASSHETIVTVKQLADAAQSRSGIRVGRPVDAWLGEALTMVAHVGQRLGEPALTSLVVGPDGSPVAAYDESLRIAGLPVVSGEARERQAAAARLECYRRFADDVPEDAEPVVGPLVVGPVRSGQRVKATRAGSARRPEARAASRAGGASARTEAGGRSAKPARPRRDPDENRAPFVVCSSCFLQTPPGDECQNCGAPLR
ncbi:hypothetical protein [Nigerium massiliense]|uniref:hypothetical protein n=1 Tax=Nigerium massiliense TaxID=1522317 RepID=UPI0011CBDA1B|nr:hypothetical protein [Nigerium massiliense]